jgi:hypothetical protein
MISSPTDATHRLLVRRAFAPGADVHAAAQATAPYTYRLLCGDGRVDRANFVWIHPQDRAATMTCRGCIIRNAAARPLAVAA